MVKRRKGPQVADHEMIGKIGRVTGTIGPGRLGEVMVPVRGGTEAFHAYASDADDTITVGTRVVVVEYFPSRTVVVTPM
jgi:membrane protein implicated in regulation of membrane protease activity